jgi:hypothetical protein
MMSCGGRRCARSERATDERAGPRARVRTCARAHVRAQSRGTGADETRRGLATAKEAAVRCQQRIRPRAARAHLKVQGERGGDTRALAPA